MQLLIGLFLGILIAGVLAVLSSPVSYWGHDREWGVFFETRRKGIDSMNAGNAPDRAAISRNRDAYDKLVASGEVVILSFPKEKTEKMLDWTRARGVENIMPLDVLMGGQNASGRIGVVRSAKALAGDFIGKETGH